MNNADVIFQNERSEEELRESLIKEIDRNKIKENLSYQLVLNKFGLTPYIYELEQYDSFFETYRKKSQSNIDKNIVLHPFQYEILQKLIQCKNLVISAPTSFGKTYSIFEYLKISNKTKNKILIIVPTLALRNEYIEKINQCLDEHKIITNSSNMLEYDKFCLIMTHEKFIELFFQNQLQEIDFDLLVIDEIYKLQNENDLSRIYSMSLAYLTALKRAKQFVFLGPFIKNINLPDITDYELLKYDYSPVAVDMQYKNRLGSYKELCEDVDYKEKTLVYFSSKMEINTAIPYFYRDGTNNNDELLQYIKQEFDDRWENEWNVLKALKNGIGLHYNELPNFIKEYVLESYNNDNSIMILLATSTLLEGVNTSTKRLLITSDKIGSNRLTDFEFWNLVGRAGRLGKYKVGNVLYYGKFDDFEKSKKYIELNNLWINDKENIDEYQLINDNQLQNVEKQEKMNLILSKYNITIDEVKFILLPFFVKIDTVIDFFDDVFPNMLKYLKPLLIDTKNSRKIREKIFEIFKEYKPLASIGPLPRQQFSILSDAFNMSNNSRNKKIVFIVDNGRKTLEKYANLSDKINLEKLNNIYNYSFYMVNNYIPNCFLPSVNILKLIVEKNNFLTYDEKKVLSDCIFKQAENYSNIINDNDIFETLGVISPLKEIIKSCSKENKKIETISDLKEVINTNEEKILSQIKDNKLYNTYFKIIKKKISKK